ncbi:MAG TPA: DUF5681 domain-containing protein [Stellaceae bacterium]|nr:DUF5681 domain-containing protein [Stellaceae bacterium]
MLAKVGTVAFHGVEVIEVETRMTVASDPSCYLLFSGPGIEEFQSVDPDPFLPRARDTRGRFAKGSSGNPSGRPRGIPNPKRRVPDLAARPLSAGALSNLIERRPHLLRPLAAQLLPSPLAPIDPAECLGIDLSSLRTAEDLRRVLSRVLAAIARGKLAPAEGARIARRMRARLRARFGASHEWRVALHSARPTNCFRDSAGLA